MTIRYALVALAVLSCGVPAYAQDPAPPAYALRFWNAARSPVAEVRVSVAPEAGGEGWDVGPQPVACAERALCSVPLPLPYGRWTVVARVRGPEPDAEWSDPSAPVVVRSPTADWCVGSLACRHDGDDSGGVSVSDFAGFLRVLGRSWQP